MTTAEIKSYKGAPTLFVNGTPWTGMMFHAAHRYRRGEEDFGPRPKIAEFAAQDIHLSMPAFVGLEGVWTGPGEFDFSPVDKTFASVVEADPDGVFIPRVSVEPPEWWRRRYPEELGCGWRVEDAVPKPEAGRASFSSERWRRDAGEALRRYVRHVEDSPFADALIGYHVCAGASNEWGYSWSDRLPEYSVSQRAAFRNWLSARYGGDIERLREAWKDAEVTFDTAEIPPPSRRTAGDHFDFFDPSRGRWVPDYMEFQGQVVADAILHFVGIVKEASLRRKLCGVFHGYYFFSYGGGAAYVGHRAVNQVLESADVDYVSAPNSYRERQQGGVTVAQNITGSIRLHGKLYYDEDDTRTALSAPDSEFGRVDTVEGTAEVLKRNFAHAVAAGGALWWMEQAPGWYSHPTLLRCVGQLERVARRLLEGGRRSAAEIAVVVSNESTRYMRQEPVCYPDVFEPLVNAQMHEHISRIGAPYDTYSLEDIDEIPVYPLTIFLNVPYVRAEYREAIRRRLAEHGGTALWVYAPGYVTDDGLSTEHMSELTGMRLTTDGHGGKARLAITDYSHPVTECLPRGLQWSTPAPVGPLFWCDDAEAQGLAELYSAPTRTPEGAWSNHMLTHRAGLACKPVAEGAGWNSVWCGVPGIPAVVLRSLARWAGAHVYSDEGDAVVATNRMLAVHTRHAGTRRLRLPPQIHGAVDAFSERSVPVDDGILTVDMEAGQTGMWLLETAPDSSQ